MGGNSHVEFVARVAASTTLKVLYNDSQFLAEVSPSAGSRYYNYLAPSNDPVWNIVLVWDVPDGNKASGTTGVMKGAPDELYLDPDFGLRLDGQDLTPCMQVERLEG